MVDPEHVTDGDIISKIDNNYGLLQAVNRIQNWPDGAGVPIVLILTKSDKNRSLLKKHGGPKAFIEKYFSRMILDIKGIKGCSLSSIEYIKYKKKKQKQPISIEEPLIYCLDRITKSEDAIIEKKRKERHREYVRVIEEKEKRKSTKLSIIVTSISLLVFFLLLYLTDLLLPSTIWHNLWQNTVGRFL